MGRYLAGAGALLLLIVAGIFAWRSGAHADAFVPPAPQPDAFVAPLKPVENATPPEASEKSREEKRFARADKNKDGRITAAELLEPRRKAYAKLDTNGDGRLNFEEWAVKTSGKFAAADADRSGWLSPAEYATTRAKPAKKKCAC